MRSVVLIEYLSLDGVIQAPGHAEEDRDGGFAHGGWAGPFMHEHRRYMTEAFAGAGALLLGRKTYEIFASYWPTVTSPDDEIARVLNAVPKYVASTTLAHGEWRETTVIGDEVPSRVRELKQQRDKDIFVVGSSVLARTLLEHDLVDTCQLWLHPVVLGTGKRLFGSDAGVSGFKLADSRTTAGGLVLLTYERAAA
ncbi:MAG: hypothetical protein QOC77_413 [Thermoleophilaceae bacterium]|nr:hypothetical protein [Thermoleophilaceae bacterium]